MEDFASARPGAIHFGGVADPNRPLRIGLKIDKHPIHIRPMQICEIFEVHELSRLGELVQGLTD
jgi:hypothetical protein